MVVNVSLTELSGMKIILGVTGGIAAYKSAELLRLLVASGASVRVVMTPAAVAFVSPLTFQALSGKPVHLELLDPVQESGMGHIELARWADKIVVAPASADFIARLRGGFADDLLTTVCLASKAPIVLVPAMNQAMWANAATRDNAETLVSRGLSLLGPVSGVQACGDTGLGRMMEPADIVSSLLDEQLPEINLEGLTVVVSAGPTREPIDPVRFLTNRSSGKMGYAICEAAKALGARVVLVSGPTSLSVPDVSSVQRVDTAEEMYQAVMAHISEAHIYVGTAAVSDFTPVLTETSKIKKGNGNMILEFKKTRDILAEIAVLPRRPFLVGFAAETGDLAANARDKLLKKSLDMVAANQVGPGIGFDTDENELMVYWNGGEQSIAFASKKRVATQLMELVAKKYHAKYST